MRDLASLLPGDGADSEHALALCIRLTRRDGIAHGFTTADVSLFRDGLVFDATAGLDVSAIVLADAGTPHLLELSLPLEAGWSLGADISNGALDEATVTVQIYDRDRRDVAPVILVDGLVGEGSLVGDRYTIEVARRHGDLAGPPTIRTSPECRARLGDTRCGVPLRKYTELVRVLARPDDRRIELPPRAYGPSALLNGRVRVIEPKSGSTEYRIVSNDGVVVTLDRSHSAVAGDLVEIRPGCDKRLATCVEIFDNVLNFRGEPHLPGAAAR